MVQMARKDSAPLRAGLVHDVQPADEDVLLFIGAWRLAAYTDNLEQGALLGRRLVERTQDEPLRLRTRILLAEYAINTGRLADALQQCDDARLGAAWGLAVRAYFVALPFSGAGHAQLAVYADSLKHWQPISATAGLAPGEADADGLTTRLVAYPKALLALQLGDSAGALRYARELNAFATADALAPLARGLAHYIRAEVAWARQDADAALAEFDAAGAQLPLRYRLTLFGGFALPRFRRAELLQTLGRSAEALHWYGTFKGGDSAGEMTFRNAIAHALGSSTAS
jgi:tetratricopeptide (TPR) repeat protein